MNPPEQVADLSGEAPALLALTPEDLADLGEELTTYHAHFAPLFARREQRAWAEVYLHGLLLTDVRRKNTEAMALRLLGAGPHAGSAVRALQQFIGEGAWDDDAVLAAHRPLVAQTLGEEDGVLIIDGSEVPKRGTHSVGVARQWCGATGKTDNCQAGVFLAYASRKGYTLLDRRLYLHESWFAADQQALWAACAIPADVPFQRKAELAAEMVERVCAEGTLPARWLTCDEWYGGQPAFLDRVAATGLWYLAEVPVDTPVWAREDPATGAARARPQRHVPPRAASGKGRRPTKEKLHPASPPAERVDLLAAQLPPARWQRYRLLEGSKGPLVVDIARLRAVASRDGLPGPEVWVLFRRAVPTTEAEAPELKCYLSWAPPETPLGELVRVSGLRWPIEMCLEEGKKHLGLDHYELRFWRGWHHHMTLVILAHHFLVRLRQRLSQRGGACRSTAPRAAAARMPGYPGGVDPAHPHAPAPAELGRGPTPAARRVALAAPRCGGRPGPGPLPAAAQGGGLSLPSPAHSAPA